MPVTSAVGSIQESNTNFGEIINSSKAQIDSIVNGVNFSQGYVDFAGMDVNNVPFFESTIDNYRASVQGIIDGFNADADMERALKGEVATAVHGFLTAMKELLKKYVQAIDIEKKEIHTAAESYTAAAGSISGNVSGDADTIRGASNGIEL